MAVEVTPDKVVDLLLGLLVKVLEFVNGGELGDIKAIGKDSVRLPLQQVFGLVCCNVGDSREDITSVSGGALYAVPVVDTTLACLRIHIEPLEVVVEVDRSGAEVASEECGVSGEDGGNVDLALTGQGEGDAGKPLVEVRNDGLVFLVAYELETSAYKTAWGASRRTSPKNHATR